jgi:pimeloyl-ACP methyl ester carboxylesterase
LSTTTTSPDTDYTSTWTQGRGEVKLLTRANGTRLRYLEVGEGPPLVLLHTVRTQLDYFQLVIPLLWDSFTVYALDLPGMGWSDIVEGASYEEPDLRAAVVELISQLGLEGVTLAGESMGGTVALSAAVDLSGRVSRVVAFNPYDYPEGAERGNVLAKLIVTGTRLPITGPVFARLENKLLLRAVMRGGFADNHNLPEPFLTELRRAGRRKGYAHVARAVFRNLNSLRQARGRYPLVAVPVDLVYGDGDWSRPSDREAVELALRDVRLALFPDTGHFTALERPAHMAEILLCGVPGRNAS